VLVKKSPNQTRLFAAISHVLAIYAR